MTLAVTWTPSSSPAFDPSPNTHALDQFKVGSFSFKVAVRAFPRVVHAGPLDLSLDVLTIQPQISGSHPGPLVIYIEASRLFETIAIPR